MINGDKVFELYDTYGFPLDLTSLLAREAGREIDVKGFEEHMAAQKERARRAAASQVDDWEILSEDATCRFIGYDTLECDVKISKYRRVENKKGTFYQLVFPVTPFYAESGGQVGDTGYLEAENGVKVEIINTVKENNLPLHIIKKLPEGVNLTGVFHACVDKARRAATTANHSATHLLQKALREVLGTHVEQKGSSVGPEGLRFDFSHFSKMTPEEIQRVEDLVNKDIVEGYPLVENRAMKYEDAVRQGAMALFGEKYGDAVRTIKFGDSHELCGGTHVDNTMRVRLFKILSEGGIAAGIRRIEAVTGEKALEYYKKKEIELQVIRDIFKGNRDVEKAALAMVFENDKLKKELETFMIQKIQGIKEDMLRSAQSIGDVTFMYRTVELDPIFVKNLMFELGKDKANQFIVVGNKENNYKVSISVYISKELAQAKGWHAGKIVKQLAACIGGNGGGQEFYATAGGKIADGLQEAYIMAEKIITGEAE